MDVHQRGDWLQRWRERWQERRKENEEKRDDRREDRKVISGNRKWIVLGIVAGIVALTGLLTLIKSMF